MCKALCQVFDIGDIIQWSRYSSSLYFVDKETEAQRIYVTYVRSQHNWWVIEPGIQLRFVHLWNSHSEPPLYPGIWPEIEKHLQGFTSVGSHVPPNNLNLCCSLSAAYICSMLPHDIPWLQIMQTFLLSSLTSILLSFLTNSSRWQHDKWSSRINKIKKSARTFWWSVCFTKTGTATSCFTRLLSASWMWGWRCSYTDASHMVSTEEQKCKSSLDSWAAALTSRLLFGQNK